MSELNEAALKQWIEDKMIDVVNVERHKLSMLLVGPNGSGKTYMLSTAPKPFIIAAEYYGVQTLRAAFAANKTEGWKVVQAMNWTDVLNGVDYLEMLLKKGECPYETVCLDTLTEAQRYNLLGITTQNDRAIPAMQDYGQSLYEIREFLLRLTALPLNLIVTCQAEQQRDEELGISMWRPQLTGQIVHYVGGYFDLVGFCRTRPGAEENQLDHGIQFVSDDKRECKNRGGFLMKFERPVFSTYLERVLGKQKEERHESSTEDESSKRSDAAGRKKQ
jgi:hypothetical protein